MATFTYALDTPMPVQCHGGVLTIGNFDGVHVGHQTLLAEAVRQARAMTSSAIAVTFDPHPSQILRPDRIGPPLTTLADRTAHLHQHGVDHVVILQTSAALLQLSARGFFDQIVIDRLQAKGLVEGFNFGFGRNREGTIEVLTSLCAGKNLPLTLMPPQAVLGRLVSSSQVRSVLLAGHVDVVTQLLGRQYRITGVVGTGQKRGATLGFPTANLHDIPTLIPGNGVYAVRAHLDGVSWPGAANIGPNPTFGEGARKVEVHLIGFAGLIYDKNLSVDFVKQIRDTKAFASVQELTAQIQDDIESAKKILNV